jgi:hypothetical protein
MPEHPHCGVAGRLGTTTPRFRRYDAPQMAGWRDANDLEYKFSLKGLEIIGDLVTTVLEIALKEDKTTWNVNPSTERVLRAIRMARSLTGTATLTAYEYSDWRTVDNVSVLFRIAESGPFRLSTMLNPLSSTLQLHRAYTSGQVQVEAAPPELRPRRQIYQQSLHRARTRRYEFPTRLEANGLSRSPKTQTRRTDFSC